MTARQQPAVRRLTEAGMLGWLGQAQPGDRLTYYRGRLALDTVPAFSPLPPTARLELIRIAARARWAAEQNLAHLVQRREGADDFSYLIVARPRPARSADLLTPLLAAVTSTASLVPEGDTAHAA